MNELALMVIGHILDPSFKHFFNIYELKSRTEAHYHLKNLTSSNMPTFHREWHKFIP